MVQTRRAVSRSSTRLTRENPSTTTKVKTTMTSKDNGSRTSSITANDQDVKKKVTTPVKVNKKPKRTRITEQEVLKLNNDELVDLVNELVNTEQDILFKNHKITSEKRINDLQATIDALQQELGEKDQLIDTLQSNRSNGNTSGDVTIPGSNSTPRSTNGSRSLDAQLYISPVRKKKNIDDEVINKDEITKEFETIGVILDLMQLLTGLKVINHEEDDERFYFDIVQNSTTEKFDKLVVDYRIIISKKFSSVAEVNYVPTFLGKQGGDEIVEILPDYFRDKLTFPYNSLSQFCKKMTQALNRVKK